MQRKTVVLAILACLLAFLGWWVWPRSRPHVLLITLDTTRADRLGCYGYGRARTPVLDSLAVEGVLCERSYTVAPLTLPAHASLFTGLYPAENGVRTNGRGRLEEGLPTLAEVLRRQGYDTGAFVASFVLDGKFGLGRGFKTYDDDFAGDEPASDVLHRQRHGEAVVDAALRWLGEARSRPFFCWVHLYDPHFPYLAHEELFGKEFADRPYDAEIAYVDRQVGRLVEFLKARGLESQTVVVVVGDHGEGLGEHVERQHGSTLYNTALQVPLLVRHPGRLAAGGRLAANVSLVDLSPTVLDLAGVADPRKITGRSFKAGLQGGMSPTGACYGATDEPFLNNGWSPLRSLIEGNWKYIKTTRVELYNLVDDPRELENLAETEPEKTQEMAAHLEAFESRLTAREEARVALSAKEKQALAGLGYLGGTRAAPTRTATGTLPDVKDMLPYGIAVEDAINLSRNGSAEAAIERLRDIVRESPSYADASIYLAGALRDKSEFSEAEGVLRDLLKLKPECSQGHSGLAAILTQQGHADEAIREWLTTIELDPYNAEAHYNAAKLYLSGGRPRQAMGHLNAALEIDRQHAGAHQWRANLLSHQGRTAEAIADLRQALKYAPNLPEAHHNLGVILAAQGQREDARIHLVRAVELSPQSAEMRYALAVFLLDGSEYQNAVRILEEALQLKPDYAAAGERLREARQVLHDSAQQDK